MTLPNPTQSGPDAHLLYAQPSPWTVPEQRTASPPAHDPPPAPASQQPPGRPSHLRVIVALLIGIAIGFPVGAMGVGTDSSAAARSSSPTPALSAPQPARPSAPAPAPVPTGPLTTVPTGTYEVGTGAGQVVPGSYRSSEPDGTNLVGCYFARLRHNDGSIGDIIDNDISEGQSLMNVAPTDGYVEVDGCIFEKTG